MIDCFYVASDDTCYIKKTECVYYDNAIACNNAPVSTGNIGQYGIIC
jgi:hypothetical protein